MYDGLMQYLETCPYLKGQRFNFDFHGGTPAQWSLHIPTNDPVMFKTPTGDAHKKLDFILVAIDHYGDDNLNNIGNLDVLQAVGKWFRENNDNDIYPDLGHGKTVKGVCALTDGYIERTTENAAQYQIQCRVEYVQMNESLKQLPRFFMED